MATEAQINANRLNALHSTGPVTDSGKAKSSRNALTLALYTRQDYVKPEERDIYKEFCDTMFLELAPIGLLQQTLASEITGASWRLRRCSAVEGDLADYADRDPLLDDSKYKMVRSVERARASAHSILHRSLNQLRKLKAEEKRQVRQVEKQEMQREREQQREEQTQEEDDPMMRAFESAIDSIMNCPAPDLSEIEAEIARRSKTEQTGLIPTEVPSERSTSGQMASNCNPGPVAPAPPATTAESAPETASNCSPVAIPAVIEAMAKRNLPCACKSGKIYRKCCGINEPKDWRFAA